MSVQSERNSFSDVDSPMSHNVENILPKQEMSIEVPSANVESTSPLLSSLLKSPTSSSGLIASNSTNQVATSVPTVEHDKKTVDENVEDDEKMEIDNEIPNGTTKVDVEPIEKEAVGENEVEELDKSDENIDEILAAAADQVNEMLPDLMSILTEAETEEENKENETADNELSVTEKNGISEETNGPETEKINQNYESENQDQPLLKEASIKEEIEDKPTSTTSAPTTELTSNDTLNTDDEIKIENKVSEVNNEVANGQADDGGDEIKIEEDAAVDEKAMLDEDKPLTSSSESKRQTRTSQSSKSVRRPRKQSDILPEDDGSEDTPARRETRSKKNSERSDDVSGGLEAASEESPLPPPLTPHGTRETRRSAAKKAQVVLPATPNATLNESSSVGDDLESSKEEKDDATTPQSVAENRRISRLKEKEASGLNLIIFCSKHFF